MLRFITFLLGREYEECKSCQTLKEQLAFERAEKKELTTTLLNILNPKVVELPPVELAPINQSAGTFTRRRAAMEERDRLAAQTLRSSKLVGVPDDDKDKITASIHDLEQQLGIDESVG